jgi:hypothetical protein
MQMRNRVASAAAALGAVVVMHGCQSGDRVVNGQMSMKGAVKQVQGSDSTPCWTFVSTSGKTYELQPGQAPHELLVDGQQAAIVAKPLTGGGSFCKVGQIISVISDSITPPKT